MTKRKKLWIAGSLLLLLFMVFVAPTIVIYSDVYSVCWNTASTKGYREWPFGLRTGDWNRVSPLESYMAAHNMKVSHKWVCLAKTGENFYGHSVSFGDGMTNGTELLRYNVLTAWMEGRSDKEIRELCALLATNDRESIEKRAREIYEETRIGG